MEKVWVVTYYDMGFDPLVTVFNNKAAALKRYASLMGQHDRVNVIETFVLSRFTSDFESKDED